jgi:hypothetical protein
MCIHCCPVVQEPNKEIDLCLRMLSTEASPQTAGNCFAVCHSVETFRRSYFSSVHPRRSPSNNALDMIRRWKLRCPGGHNHCGLICSLWNLNMLCIAGTVSFDLPVMWGNWGSVNFFYWFGHLCQNTEYKCNIPSDVTYWTAYIILYVMRIM